MPDRKLLAIYLNDHLAGATAGREVARRSASSNRRESLGEFLAELADRLEVHRQILLDVMRTLDIGIDHVKELAGWSAEKLGRFKLNGRLLGYSPLSRMVELEALALGSQGRLGLWHTLLELDLEALEGFDFAALADEAELQRARLDAERRRAAVQAFA